MATATDGEFAGASFSGGACENLDGEGNILTGKRLDDAGGLQLRIDGKWPSSTLRRGGNTTPCDLASLRTRRRDVSSLNGRTKAQAKMEYIVLEKHQDILTTLGGTIGLLPNGARILDQLGIYEAIEDVACPVTVAHTTFPDGFVFRDDYPAAIHERKVRVPSVDPHSTQPDPSVVQCALKPRHGQNRTEGDEDCDVVVGADGVHSVVRSQMWQLANTVHPGLVSEEEQRNMRAEYSCVFGMASPIEGINAGEQLIACHDDTAILVFPEKNDCIGWALIQKLDKPCIYPNMPRFSPKQTIAMGQAAADLPVYRKIRFGDLWARTATRQSTVLEEGLLQTWHHGRIVCVGDSMTPNIAQGANTGIEGAAALANVLLRIGRIPNPSEAEIAPLLQTYAECHQNRLRHIHAISHAATRGHTRSGWFQKLAGRYIYPVTPNAVLGLLGGIFEGAPCLEYVPLPARCQGGWDKKTHSYHMAELVGGILVIGLALLVACCFVTSQPRQM
ncbi:hypothetical protein FE257_000048 [Aspergillus nanangensis]|uniref:FAD-binding domain-containing protein n=1 Tax=Aspergillus nanangensis TaxID=2582783 RepID=A0AAD4CZ42_ASPNN|nr:hypothetical protein FE257_000048 [Aspergillus nanangensis]